MGSAVLSLPLSFIPIPFLSHPSLISPDPFAHFSRFPSLIGILYKRGSVKAGGQRRDILNEGRTYNKGNLLISEILCLKNTLPYFKITAFKTQLPYLTMLN